MKKIITFILHLGMAVLLSAQNAAGPVFPVKGFCIGAPATGQVDRFAKFINEELATRGVNTLILLVDYGYKYQSYPQFRDKDALSRSEVKKIVRACRGNDIRIIPQINLLGHQSWEVRKIRDHLASNNMELWIWGDRLLDGKTTGIGLWEASYNYTYRAVDMIPKDVVICDWHYERPDQTPIYFAMKGFRVITCPWRTPATAVIQAEDMARWRKSATKEMKPYYYGMMQTTWTSPENFMDGFYGVKKEEVQSDTKQDPNKNPWDTFRAMYKRMEELEVEKKKE